MPLGLVFAMLTAFGGPVSVSDFGAKPNSRTDATEAVARAMAAVPDGGTLVFPKGDYHFYRDHGFEKELFLSNSDVANPRKIAILIENRHGLKVVGQGARLIFHDRIMPFAVLASQDVDLSGFTIDWERPLMSQGTVVESGKTGFTLKVDPKRYPFVVEAGKLYFTDPTPNDPTPNDSAPNGPTPTGPTPNGPTPTGLAWKRRPWAFMEFDPKTRGVAPGTGDAGFTDGDATNAQVTDLGKGLLRFAYICTRFPKVGHVLVARHGVRDHAGTYIQDSKNVHLKDIKYRHTSGLGVLSQYSENLTFERVDVAEDPKSDRMFAGHDDGFHFSNCKGDILVDGCHFEGLMDDPINVHGTGVKVVAKLDANRLRCRFMHEQSVGLRFGDPGDKISFLDHNSMLSRATGLLASLKRLSLQEFEVTFQGEIPEAVNVGDALENLTWTPNFTVRRSVFGTVRARGLLVSTPGKVLVEDCLFRSSGAAILIAGDANYWYETGAVTDVTIRHNRFVNCNTSPYQFGDAVISIHPEIPMPGEHPYHRNITIEDNEFVTFDAPLLWAKSVSHLAFRRNRVMGSAAYEPRNPREPGLTLIDCEDVDVRENSRDVKALGNRLAVQGGKPGTIHIQDWAPQNLKSGQQPHHAR
jgi:hypothetical protein